MSVLSHFRRVPAFRFPLGLVVAVFLGISGCRQERSMSTVPDFTLPEVRGGSFHLRAERFPAILLAFLQALPDTLDTPSRQQVGFLLSMQHQYGSRGLMVVVIDSSALANGESPKTDALLNASHDWHLEIPLLEDKKNHLGKSLGITEAPTLLLLSSDGTIIRRWNGLTGPVSLAEAIEKVCAGPSVRAGVSQ